MSLIHAISPADGIRGCAWAWGVRAAHWILADCLQDAGCCAHNAGAIAHRMSHGGLFSDRTTAERWIA
jgi:hypothetical protein